MERKLILNDGTVIDDAEVLLVSEKLFVYLYGEISFADAFAILNDPDKVSRIAAEQYGETKIYKGYRELYTITKQDSGIITAGLRA